MVGIVFSSLDLVQSNQSFDASSRLSLSTDGETITCICNAAGKCPSLTDVQTNVHMEQAGSR